MTNKYFSIFSTLRNELIQNKNKNALDNESQSNVRMLHLLATLREVSGDHGKRMQDEFIEFISDLKTKADISKTNISTETQRALRIEGFKLAWHLLEESAENSVKNDNTQLRLALDDLKNCTDIHMAEKHID